ncbi:TCR beta variable region [Triplophysa rosa]|nr:TCR beta variable region [Triplophysa rosa]
MRFVIIITVTMINLLGYSLCNKVDQSPADEIKIPGESVKIQCKHSVANYNQINWYRQNLQNKELTFMGYLLAQSGKNTEKDFTDKIELSGDGNSEGFLTIKNLLSNDSAVYFCAAYYTVSQITVVHYKNILFIFL